MQIRKVARRAIDASAWGRKVTRRAINASVWGKNPVGTEDERVQGLLRFGYPWTDVTLVLFGLGGLLYGIPALRDVFSSAYSQAWSGTIAVVSFICLIGVSFPSRFWRVELVAKSILVTLLAVYGFALMIAGVVAEPDDFGRSAVGFMPLALIGPLAWRVFDIPREARRRASRRALQEGG